MIVLGDGVDNRGVDPLPAAKKIFKDGGIISVVAAGISINQTLLEALTGNNDELSFTVKKFDDKFRLVNIMEKLSVAICDELKNKK